MDGTNICSRSHRRHTGGVHSVVLPQGRGHINMNKGCKERGKTRFYSVCVCFHW